MRLRTIRMADEKVNGAPMYGCHKESVYFMFQKEIETMPRAQIEALQLNKLKAMVSYCYNKIPFYHKRLTECGVLDGSKIRQLSLIHI